jgi:hypothetical protein
MELKIENFVLRSESNLIWRIDTMGWKEHADSTRDWVIKDSVWPVGGLKMAITRLAWMVTSKEGLVTVAEFKKALEVAMDRIEEKYDETK